jgi:hypothetical protein
VVFDVDTINVRSRRPSMQQPDQILDGVTWAFQHDLERAVALVAHCSAEACVHRVVKDIRAKSDHLHPAANHCLRSNDSRLHRAEL